MVSIFKAVMSLCLLSLKESSLRNEDLSTYAERDFSLRSFSEETTPCSKLVSSRTRTSTENFSDDSGSSKCEIGLEELDRLSLDKVNWMAGF